MRCGEGCARVLPFALFMGFIGLSELLTRAAEWGWLSLSAAQAGYLYPLRAFAAALALFLLRRRYEELRWGDLRAPGPTFLSIGVGFVVFVLWIQMDFTFGSLSAPAGYDPYVFESPAVRTVMIAFRLAGAALVVPVMEELFWRSFLLRYIVDKDFSRVEVGHFTWLSFGVGAVLFGLEHHFIVAGIMAGAAYSLLLYRTKSIAQCVLSHAVTNLALGIYVLQTGHWQFW